MALNDEKNDIKQFMDDFKRFLPLDKSDTNKRATRNLGSGSDKKSGDDCDSGDDSDRRILSSKV